MNENEQPRICELLGVNVGEEFSFPYPNIPYDTVWIDEDGILYSKNRSGYVHKCGGAAVCWLINHPKSIKKKPKLTDAELKICNMLGAAKISRMAAWVYLFDENKNTIAQISSKFFPSVEMFENVILEKDE